MDDTENNYCKNFTKPVKSEPLPSMTDDDDRYQFALNPRRGVAVIIINLFAQDYEEGRKGWEFDLIYLQNMFTHLGFEVRSFVDKGLEEIKRQLKAISKEDHTRCDCFALALSSHGDQTYKKHVTEDTILFKDGTLPTRKLLEYFTDTACQQLKGKPRLFFLQACRGYNLDHGVDMEVQVEEEKLSGVQEAGNMSGAVHIKQSHVMRQQSDKVDAVPVRAGLRSTAIKPPSYTKTLQNPIVSLNIKSQTFRTAYETTKPDLPLKPAPCEKDFLVMYATPPGYFAFRRPTEGSWFIKALSEILSRSNGELSLTRELTRVIGQVARDHTSYAPSHPGLHEKKQSPVLYTMLTKDVYFVPKTSKMQL